MKVFIVSEISPGGLYHSYRRGFESLGCQVDGVCSRVMFERASLAGRSRVGRRILPGRAARAFNGELVDAVAASNPDLVFVIKGQMVSSGAVRAIAARTGAPVVNFYPDDPFSEVSSNRLHDGPSVLASYDHCFTFARHLEAGYRAAGAERVHYLPFARDPEMHTPPVERPAAEFGVVFVGNLDAERIPWIEAAAPFGLAVFGEHTEDALPRRSPARAATFLPAEYETRLPAALARGAISLNVMRRQNRLSHNMRSFESPASGAFTLSQWTPELERLFVGGAEVAFARSPDELTRQIEYFLERPEERARIAEAGWERVREDTYAVRAQTILDAVEAGAVAPLRARHGS